jgi:hypothetical protein
MSEERKPYMTLEDARALLAAVEQPGQPQLPLVRTLRDRGLIPVDLFKQLEGEIQRSQGQADAILEYVTAGGEINPEQALKLLIAALNGDVLNETAIARAVEVAAPSLNGAQAELVAAVRSSHDREVSVKAFKRMCAFSSSLSNASSQTLLEISFELISKIASSSGEISHRKRLTLQVIQAALKVAPAAVGRLVENGLSRGVLRTYDVVHDAVLLNASINNLEALLAIAARAEAEADLSAACSVVGKITDEAGAGRYIRTLCKQFGDGKKPTLADAQSVQAGLAALIKLHVAAPSAPAASHDEALLRRWAIHYPSEASKLIAAADEIGAARAPFTERFKAERVGIERLALAKRHVKECVVPAKQIVLLVGGTYSHDVIDAFNEFHPANPVWGEWILKERVQPLKSGEIDERIGSVKCAGVVIIAKPAGHSIVEQAKVAVGRHEKTHVIIHNSSKNALREGLTNLLVKLSAKWEVANG